MRGLHRKVASPVLAISSSLRHVASVVVVAAQPTVLSTTLVFGLTVKRVDVSDLRVSGRNSRLFEEVPRL